ncbi:MAG: TonB-dependent receptor [Bryobacterales bacterium]|nr:TonB-dependent receptor [Bryobacterales bacterium]
MNHTVTRAATALVVLGLLSSIAYGQAVTGSLVGTVTDSSSAAVPGAKVTLVETRTGISQTTTSNQSGNYSFPALPPGNYRVEVELQGFRKAIKSGVDVLVNSTIRTDLELTPGAVSEVINVQAESGLLQTDRSDTGRKIETRQLADLPLTYNRNFQSVLNLVPGTVRAFRPHSEFFNVQDSLSTRVNGQSRMANNVQMEGVDNNQRTGLLTAMIPSIEALQTVDVTTSNYEAELGRAGGAVTNVNFKSGTNEVHGSLFEFNKVSRLGARSFFASGKAVTTYNMFGGTIGGPIAKNKTFYFADFQGVRDRRGDFFQYTIPSAAFRTGNLSAGTQPVYDPATGDANALNRTPFAGNIVPASRISPISARVLALIPAPNRNAGLSQNWERATVRKKDTNGGDIKVDHQLSDKDRFSVRYSIQRSEIFDPPLYDVKGGGPRDFAGTGIQKAYNGAIGYTRVWSPTWLSEVRIGIMYYRNNANNADGALKTADELGIKGVNVSDFTGGVPSFNINGFSNPVVGYSASLPWERGETNLNFVVNTTKTRGNHTIKFGVDYRRNRDELLQNQTFNPRGRYTFNEANTQLITRNATGTIGVSGGTTLANSFASFLLDRPNQFGRDLPLIFPTFLQRPWFSYIQDKWQVTQKLTVDIGLRHELWPPAVPRVSAGFSNYDPATNSLVLAGVGGNPMNMGRKNYLTNFAPRFGAAYRHNEKTVVRMGYGISWAPLVDNGYAFNFPVRENNSFEAPNSWSPAGAMADGFPAFKPFAIPSNGIIPNAPVQVYNAISKDVRESYVQSWNLAIQRTLPKNFVLETAYVANHGVGVKAVYNINAGLVPNAGVNGRPLFQRFGRNADTNDIYFGTSTTYHSMQAKLDRRFANGFALTTAYTWAKAIDLSGADNGGLWVYINPERSRARADGDRRHVFVQSYVYELPFGKGKNYFTSGPAAQIFGGWQLNGLLTLMTGEPFNLSVAGGIINAPGNANTPNLTGSFKALKDVGPGSFWFDTSVFSSPAAGTFGTLGRNILSGPGFAHLDASIFRTFKITERWQAQFRAEAINFSNTPHFNNPNGDITSPNFGRVVGVNGAPNGPREMQLGLKITF